MFGFLKFLFFCVLAIAAGVAAVSVPVAGKTVAAHVQALIGDSLGEEPSRQAPAKKAAAPAAGKPRALSTAKPSTKPAARPAADRPKPRAIESDPTPAERQALDQLIGAKTSGR